MASPGRVLGALRDFRFTSTHGRPKIRTAGEIAFKAPSVRPLDAFGGDCLLHRRRGPLDEACNSWSAGYLGDGGMADSREVSQWGSTVKIERNEHARID